MSDDIVAGMMGAARAHSWADAEVGDSIDGVVTGIRSKQGKDFKTKRPEVWQDGSPKHTPVWTIATGLAEDEEDDGERDLYARGGVYSAIRRALREAYSGKGTPTVALVLGAHLRVEFTGTEPSDSGVDRKVYSATLTPA